MLASLGALCWRSVKREDARRRVRNAVLDRMQFVACAGRPLHVELGAEEDQGAGVGGDEVRQRQSS